MRSKVIRKALHRIKVEEQTKGLKKKKIKCIDSFSVGFSLLRQKIKSGFALKMTHVKIFSVRCEKQKHSGWSLGMKTVQLSFILLFY